MSMGKRTFKVEVPRSDRQAVCDHLERDGWAQCSAYVSVLAPEPYGLVEFVRGDTILLLHVVYGQGGPA